MIITWDKNKVIIVAECNIHLLILVLLYTEEDLWLLHCSIEEGDFIIINFEPFKLLMNFFALTTNYSNCSCISNQSNHEIETSITINVKAVKH